MRWPLSQCNPTDARVPLASSVRRVVDWARALDTDGETEAVDGTAADRTQAVHVVGRDVDEVARTHVAILVANCHDTSPGHHEVPLVRRVSVREDCPAGCHLELIDQLHEAAVGDLLQLAWMHQVPDRHRAVVFDLGFAIDDRPHIHGRLRIRPSCRRPTVESAVYAGSEAGTYAHMTATAPTHNSSA